MLPMFNSPLGLMPAWNKYWWIEINTRSNTKEKLGIEIWGRHGEKKNKMKKNLKENLSLVSSILSALPSSVLLAQPYQSTNVMFAFVIVTFLSFSEI